MLRNLYIRFITFIGSRPLSNKVLLGRWDTLKSQKAIETTADWATEDHCGCCNSLLNKK